MLVFPAVFPNQHFMDTGMKNGFQPWRVMIRFEQWDWSPLRQISLSCNAQTHAASYMGAGPTFTSQNDYAWSNPYPPNIAYLGNGRAFHGSQIQYAWLSAGDPAPNVTWLWRFELGPIDWKSVIAAAEQSDFVVTAPNYVGDVNDGQDLDNVNNVEFANRLQQDGHFQPPIHLQMGRLDPVDVLVFRKQEPGVSLKIAAEGAACGKPLLVAHQSAEAATPSRRLNSPCYY